MFSQTFYSALEWLRKLSLAMDAPRENVRILTVRIAVQNTDMTDSEIEDSLDDFLNNAGIIPLGSCIQLCETRPPNDAEWKDIESLYPPKG